MLVIMNVRHLGEFKNNVMNNPNIKPTTVVYLNYAEFQYDNPGTQPTFKELIDYVNLHNAKLYIVNNNCEEDFYLHDVNDKRFQNTELIRYPTYFFHRCATTFKYHENRIKNNSFNHLFVCLNLKPHWWRALQVDLLEKHDLFKHGAISWAQHIFDENGNRLPFDKLSHKWEYWTPKIIQLSEENILHEGCGWRSQLPDEYFSSFMQLVTESTIHCNFITEKTVTALAMKKPFLVSAAPKFHFYLKELGFELFEEIFDYSFDTVEDHVTRFDLVAKNIHSLTKYSKVELTELYNFLLPKIEHNYNMFNKIAKDYRQIPKFVRDLCESNHEAIKSHDVYSLYHRLKNEDNK